MPHDTPARARAACDYCRPDHGGDRWPQTAHTIRNTMCPRHLLPDTAHGTSRDGSSLPLYRHPPSPPQHHVLAPRVLRARPPRRTERRLSPSSSRYVPAHPTLPCGVTETSPLRGWAPSPPSISSSGFRFAFFPSRSTAMTFRFSLHWRLTATLFRQNEHDEGRHTTERPLGNPMLLTQRRYSASRTQGTGNDDTTTVTHTQSPDKVGHSDQ